jgi:hypothetical protein
MSDPSTTTGADAGWIATIGTVVGIVLLKVTQSFIIPLIKSWSPRKNKSLQIEGYGHEIILKGHPNFIDREGDQVFSFEIPDGEMIMVPGGVRLSMSLVNNHVDGQTTSAIYRANGVIAGNFAFMIYTTKEQPPAHGRWTGCGVFRISANGDSVGIWLTEDIYEPGKYMVGNIRLRPKGVRRTPGDAHRIYRTPLPE